MPLVVPPFVSKGIDYLACAVHSGRLEARCRIGNTVLVVNLELILSTGASFCHKFEPAVMESGHGKVAFQLGEAYGD
jgi:hypothetical protein